ncbi:MAG: hypothetical protein A2Y07_08275 [Planctomycetes bacterium GWF2_50_10]|nr:MAG: hypothetical protein A2Y07_08275 [Planctomycetes bacterium GWF2_50_10]
MSFYDRDYAEGRGVSSFRPSGMGLGNLTPVVKYLLIINLAVHILSGIAAMANVPFVAYIIHGWLPLEVNPQSPLASLQLWRFVTYQFVHADIWHILFNMLGLFFLGPTLERHWGSRQFLFFYLFCGVMGGVAYTLLSFLKILAPGSLIGASGAILGLLAACAIKFPHFVVIFIVFPVPIRLAAIILIVIYVVNIVRAGDNAGGDSAHLAGMATGAAYVWLGPAFERIMLRRKSSAWQRKLDRQKNLQKEVDRILDKVHRQGIQSLTRSEKHTLEQATRLEQIRNKL